MALRYYKMCFAQGLSLILLLIFLVQKPNFFLSALQNDYPAACSTNY